MTEKKAKTATPHLREAPEQRQQVEHEENMKKDPLNSAFLAGAFCTAPTPSAALRITHHARYPRYHLILDTKGAASVRRRWAGGVHSQRLGDRGVKELAALANLRQLSLHSCTRISNQCMGPLSRLRKLEGLAIGQCRGVTAEGLAFLAAAQVRASSVLRHSGCSSGCKPRQSTLLDALLNGWEVGGVARCSRTWWSWTSVACAPPSTRRRCAHYLPGCSSFDVCPCTMRSLVRTMRESSCSL
jgi:hypothetical protein